MGLLFFGEWNSYFLAGTPTYIKRESWTPTFKTSENPKMMTQSRKIIGKQLINQKTVSHPPPMKQRSKLCVASSKNG